MEIIPPVIRDGFASGIRTFVTIWKLLHPMAWAASITPLQGALYQSRDIRCGSNDQHDNHGVIPERGTHNKLGNREHGNHQDDKRDRPEKVHHKTEDSVQPWNRMKTVSPGYIQDNTERQTENIGNHR